jgi:hypothetical protein
MVRWVPRLAVVVVTLLVAATVALVLASRPKLEDDRDRAAERWTPLRGPLAERYDELDGVLDELRAAGGGERDVARELDRSLRRWNELRDTSNADADTDAEARTANELEGLAGRVRATVAASARLGDAQPLQEALDAFALAAPPETAVSAYNDAARHYQETRESLRYGTVARVLGYDARPALALARP